MKETRSLYPQTIMRILYIGILLIHFLMLVFDANAQTAERQPSHYSEKGFGFREAKLAQVRDIYTSQIGVREKQGNSGVEVEKYLKYVNLPKGNAWCAAFVCWVYGRAGVVNPRSGWTLDLFRDDKVVWDRREQGTKSKEQRHLSNELEDRGKRSKPAWPVGRDQGRPPNVPFGYAFSLATGNRQLATPGMADIFGLYFPEKGRIAHVGFVDEWNDQWVVTVEGNTNVLGSREGDGVYRKRRLVSGIYKVARYVW